MDAFVHGLVSLFDIHLLLLIFCATIGGVIIGALPGLNATTGAALLLPFTLTMEPVPAIATMTAIYCSATFAGAITAILINTPGTAASATTCLDGYPLAQQGQAGRALGMAVVASTFGGIFSVICLMLAAPLLARAAYHFSPPEYFALTLFGLSMLASIGDGSAIKNLIAGVFGILIAMIGVDNLTTVERFTFGSYHLYEGIGFVPVMIGVFGISELLVQSEKLHLRREVIRMKSVELPSARDYKESWRAILRSSGIGTFIGILPAEGATVASMIGYNEAKRWSRNPRLFGKGAIEGVAGSEAANNAATGGAMVPTLALGIPGSATAAVILAGLMVHGLQPGPEHVHRTGRFCLCDLLVDDAGEPAVLCRGPAGRQDLCPRNPDPGPGAVAGGLRVLHRRRLCPGPVDVRRLGRTGFRGHWLLHAPLRLFRRAFGHRPDPGRDAGAAFGAIHGDAGREVVADVHPSLDLAVPRIDRAGPVRSCGLGTPGAAPRTA